jgi:anaerobic selenocysteine-containing dehydrogenase
MKEKYIKTTTCTMDCPDTCALEVTVADGKIEKIAGARDGHPTTRGFICSKVSRFAERVYHQDRLLYPLKRSGPKGSGKFTRISWEEAIGEITRRFRVIIEKWGGEAIMPYHYGGSNGMLGDGFLDYYYFAKLGASRCQRTLCAAPTTAVAAGMYGKMPGVAYEDYPRAKSILIWGANPKVSNIHLVPFLKKAKRSGAFIAAVDPKLNFSSGEIDLHLPVFPGADLSLALGMIHYWRTNDLLDTEFLRQHAVGVETLLAAAEEWPVERAAAAARVNAEDILRLSRMYAESDPAVLRCGWGVERNRNGGQALAAILAMPALLGKFGVPGGGYTLSNSGAATLDHTKIFGNYRWNTRQINQTRLGQALNDTHLQPPLKALFVYNCNPAATVPDQNAIIQGLLREDLFTVVFEQVKTDTALYADILLPAVTFLEQREIKKGYGSYVVGGVQPVISPRGEAKPNEEVFAMLGRAMGWLDEPFYWDNATYMQKTAEALSINGASANPATFLEGKVQLYDFPGTTPVQFKTVFPRTGDGKIHLAPAALGKNPFQYHPVADEEYPLALVSPSNSKMITSTLGEFNYPELFLTIHPQDAAQRDIREGNTVRVFNELGEVICRVKVGEIVRPGVVSMPKGAWQKSSRNGRTSTALCPATVNEVAGGACYNDARVEVEKIVLKNKNFPGRRGSCRNTSIR